MKEIILIIRRDKNYWFKNEINRIKIQSYVFRLMEIWDSFFNINIMDFRNKIRDIASSTYMDNKFDEIHLYSHIDPGKIKEKNELKNKLYENSIIIPIDEDDWVNPNLADILRGIKTEEQFFVWNYYKT